MLEADVVTYLAAQGSLSLTGGVNLFEGPMPEKPDACIAVGHYTSEASDERVMSPSLTPPGFEYERFQVMSRDLKKANAETKALAIHALLDALGTTPNFAGTGRTYFSIHSDGPPLNLGQDESSPQRWQFIANYTARKHRG